MRLAALLIALFASTAALAANAHIVPFGPTTNTPIEVHYLAVCGPAGHDVQREGSLIRITALDPSCVIVLPFPAIEKVRLPGRLPVGEYRVEVRLEGNSEPIATTEFVVRNGERTPFTVRPSVYQAHGPNRYVRVDGIRCERADCLDVHVSVGETHVGIVEPVGGEDAIRFIPPPRPAGLRDVTIRRNSVTTVLPGALYYYDDREISVFERILLPVLHSVRGVGGSQWVSEAAVSNPKPYAVQTASTLLGRMEAGAFLKFGEGYPRGAVLHVPRAEANDLAFALRIRDVSRQAEGMGTRVPVVRERDLFHGTNIPLLDLPLDPRHRVKIRIYMLDPVLSPFLGGWVLLRRGDVRLELPFTMSRASEEEPYYAEVDLPPGAVGERVNVTVSMPLDAVGWAFASVTNNETQQVTLVAPR